MSKLAVFQIVSNGVDGRARTAIHFSSLSEIERDREFDNLGKNSCYFRKVDTVLSMQELGAAFMSKLDGNDKLVLDQCLCFDSKTDSLTSPIGDQNYTFWECKK